MISAEIDSRNSWTGQSSSVYSAKQWLKLTMPSTGAEATMCVTRVMTAVLLMASGVFAQTPTNPLPSANRSRRWSPGSPLRRVRDPPEIDGEAARMMLLIDEPGTGRLFVSDMRGPLYTVTYDGRTVTQYLDVNAERWGVGVESPRRGLGVQSFAFHPQFTQPRTPGFGKLYTWTTPPTPPRNPTSSPAAAIIRTTLSCSSGPPALPVPRPTMAARPASCFGSNSHSGIITAGTLTQSARRTE